MPITNLPVQQPKPAWNRVVSSAKSARCCQSTFGPSASASSWPGGKGIWRCSTWPSTASLEAATRAASGRRPAMIGSTYLWPSRFSASLHISTRQYGRMLKDWVASIGLEPSAYGTHSMRRTKAAQIHKKTENLRAVQLLLGHTKMDSTVRYLGVGLEDAFAIAEGVEI